MVWHWLRYDIARQLTKKSGTDASCMVDSATFAKTESLAAGEDLVDVIVDNAPIPDNSPMRSSRLCSCLLIAIVLVISSSVLSVSPALCKGNTLTGYQHLQFLALITDCA